MKRNKKGEVFLSINEICYITGMTKKTFSNWVKRGMPKAGHGKYTLETIKWCWDRKIGYYRNADFEDLSFDIDDIKEW